MGVIGQFTIYCSTIQYWVESFIWNWNNSNIITTKLGIDVILNEGCGLSLWRLLNLGGGKAIGKNIITFVLNQTLKYQEIASINNHLNIIENYIYTIYNFTIIKVLKIGKSNMTSRRYKLMILIYIKI